MENTQNTKDTGRIAKNTAMLYIRMLVTIGIGLYTSRIVLQQLGVNDYGIYNVVGGIVTVFSIVSSSMTSAISRFLTYELGKGHEDKLRKVFSTAVEIQILLGLIVILLVEAGGVWFLNERMNIAPERMGAANWVLQCSLGYFFVNMISIPYNACIVAHEKMQAFAYISILEAVLKLAIAFMLFIPWFDSLKLYAVLMMLSAIAIRYTYNLYCKRHFKECKFEFIREKGIVKEILSFSGWNFIGSSSAILRDQGVNIIMNQFCGTAVNAARGLALQVNSYITAFSINFMMAVNPQIIKSYAREDLVYMRQLAMTSARLSYCLLLALSLPIIIIAPYILHLWLGQVPDYTVIFVRLVLLLGMSEALSLPLQFVVQATGKIRTYQIVVGGLQMMNFPVSYLFLYLGYAPEVTFIISIAISQICLFTRLFMIRRLVGFPIWGFMKDVYFRILLVTLLAFPIPMYLIMIYPVNNLLNAICIACVSVLISLVTIAFVGCNSKERAFIKEKIQSFTHSKFHHDAKS